MVVMPKPCFKVSDGDVMDSAAKCSCVLLTWAELIATTNVPQDTYGRTGDWMERDERGFPGEETSTMLYPFGLGSVSGGPVAWSAARRTARPR